MILTHVYHHDESLLPMLHLLHSPCLRPKIQPIWIWDTTEPIWGEFQGCSPTSNAADMTAGWPRSSLTRTVASSTRSSRSPATGTELGALWRVPTGPGLQKMVFMPVFGFNVWILQRLHPTNCLSNNHPFFHFQPPREFNLKSNWSGAPVEFFESVNYTCAGPEFHFEADFDQLAWQGARCLSNGSWQLLEPWPSCLKSKLQHIDKGLTCPVTVQASTAHLLHLSLQDWCAGTEVWNLVCLPICTTISCEWPSLEALFTPFMSPY